MTEEQTDKLISHYKNNYPPHIAKKILVLWKEGLENGLSEEQIRERMTTILDEEFPQ